MKVSNHGRWKLLVRSWARKFELQGSITCCVLPLLALKRSMTKPSRHVKGIVLIIHLMLKFKSLLFFPPPLLKSHWSLMRSSVFNCSTSLLHVFIWISHSIWIEPVNCNEARPTTSPRRRPVIGGFSKRNQIATTRALTARAYILGRSSNTFSLGHNYIDNLQY